MFARFFGTFVLCGLAALTIWRVPSGGATAQWGSVVENEPNSTVPVPPAHLINLPLLARPPVAAVSVTAGSAHACAISELGGVKCWGSNEYGQLGDGTTVTRTAPVDVLGQAAGVTSVVAGAAHTCALTADGSVKCWGENTYGQVGDGGGGVACGPDAEASCRLAPAAVAGLGNDIKAIAAGDFHTCALTADGGVRCWGNNGTGQLGDGTLTMRPEPVAVVGLNAGVTAIAAGGHHTCAIASDGVLCWGGNWRGQLGNGSTREQLQPGPVTSLGGGVRAISAGVFHTCVVTASAGMQCWGGNGNGQLGDGSTIQQLAPVAVVALANPVRRIDAGGHHTCAITEEGLLCWGGNWLGQLGDGTITDRLLPVAVVDMAAGTSLVAAGLSYTCAVTLYGGVKCWGSNESGQLGDGSQTTRLRPVDVRPAFPTAADPR